MASEHLTTTRSEASAVPRTATPWTALGLCLALFAMLLIRQSLLFFYPAGGFVAALWKETLIWLSAIALLVVIKRGERLSLNSIGIGTSTLWKSIAWGLVIAVACSAAGIVIAVSTGYSGGSASKAFDKLPFWLINLIVLRAGVVEEFFYRGYAIERLRALGLNRFVAAAIPLLIFGIGHWTGGWQNVLIAFALGGILAGFYLWRRDLVSNMLGHYVVDFVFNILPKLVG